MTATAQRQQPARPSLGPVELALVAMLREAARTRAERRGNLAAMEGWKR
jgi:hypothetical protein